MERCHVKQEREEEEELCVHQASIRVLETQTGKETFLEATCEGRKCGEDFLFLNLVSSNKLVIITCFLTRYLRSGKPRDVTRDVHVFRTTT